VLTSLKSWACGRQMFLMFALAAKTCCQARLAFASSQEGYASKRSGSCGVDTVARSGGPTGTVASVLWQPRAEREP